MEKQTRKDLRNVALGLAGVALIVSATNPKPGFVKAPKDLEAKMKHEIVHPRRTLEEQKALNLYDAQNTIQDTSYRHIVKSGDTGEGIANTYYDNPKEVAYLEMVNPNKDMNKLKIGDTIIVGYQKDIKYGLRKDRVDEGLKPDLK